MICWQTEKIATFHVQVPMTNNIAKFANEFVTVRDSFLSYNVSLGDCNVLSTVLQRTLCSKKFIRIR